LEKITALYIRVSTDEQAKEGYSVETQISRLKSYGEFNNWDNMQVFVDEGYSAKDMNRPDMQRLINLIKQGKVARVATTAIDRLSRSLLDWLLFISLCDDNNTAYICTAFNFDSSTPIGRMILQVLASFAEFERAMISERVKSVMNEKVRKEGIFLGRLPFGYDSGPGRQITINPEEAKWFMVMVDMFIEGRGLRAIAKYLNERGIKTRFGEDWSATSIKRTLTNPIYLGSLIWDSVNIEHNHDPIISLDKWNQVQARIQHMPRGGASQLKYKLSGLLFCGHCGRAMTVGGRPGQKAYVCGNYHEKGTCKRNGIRVKAVEEIVYNEIKDSLDSESYKLQINVEDYIKSRDIEWEKKERSINDRMQKQIIAWENGLIGDIDLRLARERIEKERRELEEQRKVSVLPDMSEVYNLLEKDLKHLLWAWDNVEVAILSNTLKRVYEKIVIVDGQVDHIIGNSVSMM
jgi:site-specific DNA recombinase